MTAVWEDARITMDAYDGTFSGQILTGYRWNGWVVPRFPKSETIKIVAEQEAMVELFPIEIDRLVWEGETLKFVPALQGYGYFGEEGWVQESEPCEGDIETCGPDEDGMYAIGGCSWCWFIDEWEEEETAGAS